MSVQVLGQDSSRMHGSGPLSVLSTVHLCVNVGTCPGSDNGLQRVLVVRQELQQPARCPAQLIPQAAHLELCRKLPGPQVCHIDAGSVMVISRACIAVRKIPQHCRAGTI